jgi:hypothetical protein
MHSLKPQCFEGGFSFISQTNKGVARGKRLGGKWQPPLYRFCKRLLAPGAVVCPWRTPSGSTTASQKDFSLSTRRRVASPSTAPSGAPKRSLLLLPVEDPVASRGQTAEERGLGVALPPPPPSTPATQRRRCAAPSTSISPPVLPVHCFLVIGCIRRRWNTKHLLTPSGGLGVLGRPQAEPVPHGVLRASHPREILAYAVGGLE